MSDPVADGMRAVCWVDGCSFPACLGLDSCRNRAAAFAAGMEAGAKIAEDHVMRTGGATTVTTAANVIRAAAERAKA